MYGYGYRPADAIKTGYVPISAKVSREILGLTKANAEAIRSICGWLNSFFQFFYFQNIQFFS